MELSADELALLDEISIKPPEKKEKVVSFKPKVPVIQRVQQQDPHMESFMNETKASRTQQQQHMMQEEYADDGEDEDPQGQYAPEPAVPSDGYKSIEDEKGDLLNKLARLQKKGFLQGRKFSAYSDVEELRTEYKRVMYSIEAEQSVKFQRRIMIACVTGIEFLNKRYDPFDVHLDGWSETMMENIGDYDSIFEELYGKYREKVSVAPEIKLIMMVGGSAMMFHLTNSMFKAAVPNVNDIMKQNPDLMRNMVDAVKKSTSQQPGAPGQMKGPGIDIGSLLGNFGGFPAPPQPTRNPAPPVQEDIGDDLSDIVSVIESEVGGVKDVKISTKKSRGKKKNEVEVTI
jgi:hypothetical protein